jgi:hypothetical protein
MAEERTGKPQTAFVSDLGTGDIVWAYTPKTNSSGPPLRTTKCGRITKYPIIVIAVDKTAKNVTGYMPQSFKGAARLTESGLDEVHHKWFLPVIPAGPDGGIHKPITIPGPGNVQWVNLKDQLIVAEGRIR